MRISKDICNPSKDSSFKGMMLPTPSYMPTQTKLLKCHDIDDFLILAPKCPPPALGKIPKSGYVIPYKFCQISICRSIYLTFCYLFIYLSLCDDASVLLYCHNTICAFCIASPHFFPSLPLPSFSFLPAFPSSHSSDPLFFPLLFFPYIIFLMLVSPSFSSSPKILIPYPLIRN